MFRKPAVAALLALLIAMPAAADTRIGVVDLRQALFSSNDAQAFSDKLQQDFADEEANVRSVQEEARQLKERLEKDGAMMNESERNSLASDFQDKVQEFNFLKQRLDNTVAGRKQAFLEQARPEVDAAVKELLEENDLDLILPSEAVVYVKPEMNLTQQLLEKLNQ
ncbi:MULTISPECIES: OmpH family outer membrane protein [Marinobacter]|uniref:OmpH family outer membrane protein n=1 Tax=Marinobacter xestospongiae TaxID=994319 RepID=A0ABU3VTT6_9GAMM|nr:MULTISPECIES: OmpH family outer membrane protein [Marinobacter]MCG8516791.1 OmpH family outer membrane protein [Pseudomonadales bacterium]MCK7566512.1 OmpH family outer membrane protein [Marinobacter xestospongiae]MDV2077664.1 OmpH family outer membrane protein [Marinobacter xestospongiae]UDL06638.1 OmpH family outer membrane protein [Marinobacter sp. CA1]